MSAGVSQPSGRAAASRAKPGSASGGALKRPRKPRRSADCPLEADVSQARKLAGSLVNVMRRLRRDLKRCASCPRNAAAGEAPCPLASYWNAVIDAAITEINAEWDAGRAGSAADMPTPDNSAG